MFTRSRYVVVDDNVLELEQLVGVLQSLGVACLPFHYKAETGVEGLSLSGLRILFLDVHLNGAPMTGQNADYGEIVQLLEERIDPASGPYILILWTKHLEKKADIVAYIERAVTPAKKPLTVLGLDKNKYLAPPVPGETTLDEDVHLAIQSDPRVLAIISWEHDVLAAAGATLAEIGGLIPDADRAPGRYGQGLDGILSALAVAAVGKSNAEVDTRAAVNAALAPILADRIVNQAPDQVKSELWKAAVTRVSTLPALTEDQAARMNSMVHIVSSSTEQIRTSDWGAVIAPPEGLEGNFWQDRTGSTEGELLSTVFQIEARSGRRSSKLVLVRIGASCDYAQNKPGPKPYVVGVLRPLSVVRGERPRPLGENVSPALQLDGYPEPADLITNGRYVLTAIGEEFARWRVLFRIREQLLMQITTVTASHTVRPGLLEFEATRDASAPLVGIEDGVAKPV